MKSLLMYLEINILVCSSFSSQSRQHGSNGNGDMLTFKWDFDTIKMSNAPTTQVRQHGGGGVAPAVPAHGSSSPKKRILPQQQQLATATGRSGTPPGAG